MPSYSQPRLSTAQEAFVVSLDKKIRATHYKDTQDQRDFLDKQSQLVVSFI